MKRTIKFGKISEVELELREDKQGRPVFSCCGGVWNTHHTDYDMCGQCLDDMDVKDPLFVEIRKLWRKYHLNDMHPVPYRHPYYKHYGDAWYYWPIHAKDLARIKEIIETGK